MNGAELHLAVNHLPVLGVLFGLGLAAYGLVRKEEPVVRVALGVFVLVAVAAFAADWTGGQAEHVLEEAVPTVSHDEIHEHEDIAEKTAWVAYLLGVVALATLWVSRKTPLRRPLLWGTLAVSVIVSALMGYTAYQGGQIRHTEARWSGPAASPATGTPSDASRAPARTGDTDHDGD